MIKYFQIENPTPSAIYIEGTDDEVARIRNIVSVRFTLTEISHEQYKQLEKENERI